MDAYGGISVDDLLNLPNDDDDDFLYSSSSTATTDPTSDFHHHHYPSTTPIPTYSTDLTDILCIPSDDVAELEWLSTYMDDSFTDFPANTLTADAVNFQINKNDAAFHGRSRTKRSRSTKSELSSSLNDSDDNVIKNREDLVTERRCSHCASQKTPQWRTGPMGPKTLCNACGVRYKSGRLVPEYRPASSPTFVLTQHSNSHRKVLELRRQKELFVSQRN